MEIKKYLYKEINPRWLNNKWVIQTLKIASYGALSTYLLYVSWGAWPDILTDFGHEIYMPWRLTQGDLIYKDINYDFGGAPLSVYWNTVWFRFFGASITTLVIVNLFILALIIFLLNSWLTTISDRFSAFIAVFFFISVFAFGRYTFIGNYNYVTPYSHPLIHGLVIILAMLVSLKRWGETRCSFWLWFSGLLFGLAILNKLEIAISAIATILAYFGGEVMVQPKNILKNIGITLISSILPLLIVVFLLVGTVPLKETLTNVLNQWLLLFDGRLAKTGNLLFYKHLMGIDDISGNLIKIVKWGWLWVNIIMAGLFLILTFKIIKKWRLLFSSIITISSFVSLYYFSSYRIWSQVFSPLPFMLLVEFLFFIYLLKKQGGGGEKDSTLPLKLASCVFAGTLLVKTALNANFYHYGFVLAMPATMLLIVTFIYWIPKYLNLYDGRLIFKSITLGLIIATSLSLIEISGANYKNNDFECCNKNKLDLIKTDQIRGSIVIKAVAELSRLLGPDQTFTALPQGESLNYLLRRKNPTPYVNFTPDLFLKTDEEVIIDSFEKKKPDFIVLTHMDTSEYGFPFFGQDYGVKLYKWIEKNYQKVWLAGDQPLLSKSRFGIAILQKN